MAFLHGKNLIVMADGEAIAGARSCDINISGEEIEVASATQSRWKEFIAGREEWSVSCSHLIPASGTPLKSSASMVNTFVTLRVESGLTGDVLTGRALVKSWRATGTIGNLAQGTFSFRGTGALT